MSWASKRRFAYGAGTILVFVFLVGVPLAVWLYEAPTCSDGKQNQGETAIDKGGPCPLLDERTLGPGSVLWSRAFPVRGGLYSAVAYVENPNEGAGVRAVKYRFGLYDERNILVAERRGTTFIMPGGITPVFEGTIGTGNRTVARTYFEFTSRPVWERMENAAGVLVVGNKTMTTPELIPRLSARVRNVSVEPVLNPSFVAIVFDPAANAFVASATTLSRLAPGEEKEIAFTWPDPFTSTVGRIDVLPLLPPIGLE
ncbi:hypothetical protein HY417_03335 [Candidatus Kaiserbacteria bacterium]|nr:hypothetical protein [Candidatus Kaiserbacteria bacterium]